MRIYMQLPIDIDVQQVRGVCQACQGMPDSLQRSWCRQNISLAVFPQRVFFPSVLKMKTFHFHALEKGTGNHFSILALRTP